MYILIDPSAERIEAVATLEEDALLAFLDDKEVTTWPLGRMLAVTGASALARPELAFTVLKVGGGMQPLRGPIVLTAQRGFFLDGDIIEHLLEDLERTAEFYEAMKAPDDGTPMLVSRNGMETMTHALLDECAIS